ncbi:hypothetical protein, partial [Arthrobacter gandavensis]|uniref:hypothetical protein n=1 Tax=Arthrobacter gandavensis TaxID=169960 RepID=UPI003D15A884
MFESFSEAPAPPTPPAPPAESPEGMSVGSGRAGMYPVPGRAAREDGSGERGRQLAARVRTFSAALAAAELPEAADSQLVDVMRVLEELKSAAAAVQARAAAV